MSKKWKISIFSFLFILLIFAVTACDKKSSGTTEPDWGEWTVTKAATCTEEGIMTRVSKSDSSKTETKTIEKVAHTPGAAQTVDEHRATCTEAGSHDEVTYCTVCQTELSRKHFTEAAHGHDYNSSKTAATCDHAEIITYTCPNCNDTYTVTGAPKLQHQLRGEVTVSEQLMDGETCKYSYETYDTCQLCGKKVTLTANVIEKHNYTAAVTKEATCSEKGIITYTCTQGNHSYTVEIPVNADAHTWGTGTVDGTTGFTTYGCTHCDKTKSTFNAADLVRATVPAKAVQEAEEIELKNATIALDESVKEQFADVESIVLSADEVDTATLNLDQETMAKIGDNTVFDFTCAVDGNQVSSFEGKMKVTIPYQLKAGEDPNNVAIWYLDGDNPVQIDAVYSNGNVTFETDHFSRYVVVQLTPAEICEKLGHNTAIIEEKDSTCVEYGHILHQCTRCGHIDNEVLPLVEHDFEIEETVASTYTQEGYTLYKCTHCDATKRVVIAKKPMPTDNILENFINGLLEQDYYITVTGLDFTGTMGDVDSQIKITETGNVYMISKGTSESGAEMTAIVDLSTGYTYSKAEDGYYFSTNGPKFDFNAVRDAVYKVTKLIPEDLTNPLLIKLAPVLFDVTKDATNHTITLTFSEEKLLTLYDNLLNKTIAQNIDIIMGTGTSELIPIFVSGLLEMTVEELIATLDAAGITIEAICDIVNQIAGTEVTLTPQLVNTMLAAFKNKKIIELINEYGPMIMSMLGNVIPSGLKSDTIEEKPVAANMNNDGATEDGSATQTPEETAEITTTQIVAAINGFLGQKIIDIVATAMGAPSVEAVQQMVPTKAKLGTMIEDVLSLEIVLTDEYKLKAINAEVIFNELLKGLTHAPEGLDIDITASIEHGNRASDVINMDEEVKLIKNKVNTFDISLDNNEWFVAALDEYLDAGDNNLTYTVSKTTDGYMVTSSKFKVKYIVYDYKSTSEGEGPTKKYVDADAYYRIFVRVDGDYKSVYIQDGMLKKNINMSGSLYYDLGDKQPREDSISLPYSMLYNEQTKKYTFVSNSYQDELWLPKFEKLTREEYNTATKNNIDTKENVAFYKITNLLNNKVMYRYYYVDKPYQDTFYVYFLTDTESAPTIEACSSNFGLAVNYNEYVYAIRITFSVGAERAELTGVSYAYTTTKRRFTGGLLAPGYNSEFNVRMNENKTYGNFKIVFEEPVAEGTCATKYTVKISYDGGQTYTQYVYYEYEHQHVVPFEESVDACHKTVGYKCEACNTIIESYTREDHDWTSRPLNNASGTELHYQMLTCKNCNKTSMTYDYCNHSEHCHQDEATGEYICDQCGFTWEGTRYPIMFLDQLDVDSDDFVIAYQGRYDAETMKYKFEIVLFVAYYDAEGELHYEAVDTDFTIDNDSYKYFEYDFGKGKEDICYSTIVFSREAYDAYVEAHSETGYKYFAMMGIGYVYETDVLYTLILK